MGRDREQIVDKLVDISKTFDDMHRYDYSYYVDDIIERVAKTGGDKDERVETITKAATEATQRKVIKKAYFEMLEISDDLESNGMVVEAMELDRIRNKISKEFENNIFEDKDDANA